jgi:hypothetical protein
MDELMQALRSTPIDTRLTIKTTHGQIVITGRDRPDLQTENWRCFEKAGGDIVRVRKDCLLWIEGGRLESAIAWRDYHKNVVDKDNS